MELERRPRAPPAQRSRLSSKQGESQRGEEGPVLCGKASLAAAPMYSMSCSENLNSLVKSQPLAGFITPANKQRAD